MNNGERPGKLAAFLNYVGMASAEAGQTQRNRLEEKLRRLARQYREVEIGEEEYRREREITRTSPPQCGVVSDCRAPNPSILLDHPLESV